MTVVTPKPSKSSDRPALPNWRAIRLGVLLAALVVLAGSLLVLLSVTTIGAILVGIGAGAALLVPFIGVLAPSFREPPGELTPESEVRNSYLGFVHGLLSTPEPPKHSSSDRDRGPRG